MADKSSEVTKFIDQLNLPKILAGRAGEAISQLIGDVIAIPSAGLKLISSGIDDRIRSKSLVSDAIAQQTALELVNDEEFMARAKANLGNSIIRKQANKEKIAAKAAIELGNEEISPDTPALDTDWLNNFSEFAEKASSDDMQDYLSKILAGEIRSPGRYPQKILRSIYEMPKSVLETIREIMPNSVRKVMPNGQKFLDDKYEKLIELEEYEIISGGPGMVSNISIHLQPDMNGVLECFGGHLLLNSPVEMKVEIPGYIVTGGGRAICEILQVETSIDTMKFILSEFQSKNSGVSMKFLKSTGGAIEIVV